MCAIYRLVEAHTLLRVECVALVTACDKVKRLLELPEKLFPSEGGTRSNKALVDRVFEKIDEDGGGSISLAEVSSALERTTGTSRRWGTSRQGTAHAVLDGDRLHTTQPSHPLAAARAGARPN
jgi:hypothetical protein